MAAEKLRQKVTRQLINRLAEHEHGFKRKTVRALVGLAAFYLIYMFCAGDYGLFRIHRLSAQRDRLQDEYQATVTEVADYTYRLRRLNTDPHFVEWLARTRYGYSRPNETIYRLDLHSR